ncbi:hypothetical protein SPARK1531C2_04950 [Klebsiella grimontii]|nr:hypothetical protein SPARK1531C2_04950 [Klebsiella grimontii]
MVKYDFSGRVALVTGAASGMGLARYGHFVSLARRLLCRIFDRTYYTGKRMR